MHEEDDDDFQLEGGDCCLRQKEIDECIIRFCSLFIIIVLAVIVSTDTKATNKVVNKMLVSTPVGGTVQLAMWNKMRPMTVNEFDNYWKDAIED